MHTAKSMSFLALLCCYHKWCFWHVLRSACKTASSLTTESVVQLIFQLSCDSANVVTCQRKGGARTVLSYLHIWTYICTSVGPREYHLSVAMCWCSCSPGLALQTPSVGMKMWCCPVIMWGSGTGPVGQEIESEWWRQWMADENKQWSAELKHKVRGTKTVLLKTKLMHCSCWMQFFHSWHWWDCLCNGSYPDRSGMQLVNGIKGSAGGSCSLVLLCSSPTWSFPSSDQWQLTLVLLQPPLPQCPACSPLGKLRFAWRDGSTDVAAVLLWQISAWCY